jgi:predicted nucleic acid-binding protein
MEVISGCKNKQSLKAAEIFLERFHSFSIDPESSDIAVRLLRRYNLSHGLLTADALVAAISIRNALPLLTRNQKDFRFIEELELVPTE